MNRLQYFINQHIKGLALLVIFVLMIVLIETAVFNSWFFVSKFSRLEERQYLIRDGSLYQFSYENGNLVALGDDPNITFSDVDLSVGAVSIQCKDSLPDTKGQIFYSQQGEPYNEIQSIGYDVSSYDTPIYLSPKYGFPEIIPVSSLRFDLTDTARDTVSCSELIVNPNGTFKFSPIRLVLYSVFLMIAIFSIFHDSPIWNNLLFRKSLLWIVFLFLVFILSIKLIPVAFHLHLALLVTVLILLFSGTVTFALAYLSSKPYEEGNDSFLYRYRYEIALFSIIIVTTLPLLTQPFYYYDDWWGIGMGRTPLSADHLLKYGRPIHILFFEALDPINIKNAFLFKWAFLPFVLLYSCLLYRWLSIKTENRRLSFFVASILSIFPPVMDVLGYTSTSPFTYSVLCSVLSVISFDRAFSSLEKKEKSGFVLNATLSLVFLLEALLTYQVGPQIVFVFISIEIYFNLRKERLFRKHFLYLSIFGLAHGFYLLFIKLLNNIYHVDITTNRSEIISSISQVSGKLHLYKTVFEQSIMQIIAAFTGSSLFLQRYRGYLISYSDRYIGQFLFLFVVIIILIALINYWHRTKNIIGLLSIIVFIPLSYFVFLILSNNEYLTYYAFAHISLLMFYFLIGLFIVTRFIWERITDRQNKDRIITKQFSPAYILAPVLLIIALISNYYIRDFYIGYNSQVYQYIRNSLLIGLKKGNIERIHIVGSISPINADVYSRFVTETALDDLNINAADYAITVAANPYYPERLEETAYLEVENRISEDDKQKLDTLYGFEPIYREYHINASLSENDRDDLQRIFTEANIIPQASSPDTLIIDITWTATAFYLH